MRTSARDGSPPQDKRDDSIPVAESPGGGVPESVHKTVYVPKVCELLKEAGTSTRQESPISAYEHRRNAHIAANKVMLEALAVPKASDLFKKGAQTNM